MPAYDEFTALTNTASNFASLVNAVVTFEWTTDERKPGLKVTIVSVEDRSLKTTKQFETLREAREFFLKELRGDDQEV